MSRLTRMAAVLMAALMVLAVGTPTVLADHGDLDISVDPGDTTYTVTVTHNGTAVNDSTVNVTPKDENATYAGDSGFTDENGTVTFDLPDNETEVNITATFNGSTFSTMATLPAANDTDGRTDSFGFLVSSFVQNLLTDAGNHTILGLSVSEFVTTHNPGADHRPEKANPGGNGHGPPENATNKSNNGNGPPVHAGGGANDSDGGELEIALDGEATANETVNVTVTHNDSAVENATVSLDGKEVGTTNADGNLEVTLPDEPGEEVTISAEADDLEGETELTLAE